VKEATIARNYAEALFQAGEAGKDGALDRYGRLLEAVAGAVQADRQIAVALESPRVAKATKAKLLSDALQGVAPPEFVRFLQSVVRRGRQGLLAAISEEYHLLLDVKHNRVHAGITLATADDKLEGLVVERLVQLLGKEVRPHFRSDGAILGGVVVRVGDRIYDGSVRRRLATLRRRMLVGE
jgi:F-type H+-transporting ATPase subunit delta